jgi:hypothetical protein
MIVIVPSCLNGLLNALIFLRVRSSTRRVHAVTPSSFAALNPVLQHPRDARLLKHMLLNFTSFMLGWTPIYALAVVDTAQTVSPMVYKLLRSLPILSSLINVLDLFWYNLDVRKYLKERLFARRRSGYCCVR